MKKKYIAVVVGVFIAVAITSYLIGYKTAYDRIKEKPDTMNIPQTFYAEITDIRNELFTVEGLDINDINYRGAFTFSVNEETSLVWRGTEMLMEEFDVGDIISVTFVGYVQESYPGHISDVVQVQLLDDEK